METHSKANSVLVFLSDVPWTAGWSSRRRLAEGLSKNGWCVYFSSGALNYWRRDKPEWSQAGWTNRVERHDNIYVEQPGKSSAVWPKYTAIRTCLEWSYGRIMRNTLSRLFCGRRRIVFCYHPEFLCLARAINADRLVYVLYDDLSKTHSWSKRVEAAEESLLTITDLVVGYSEAMVARIGKKKPSLPCHVMGLGVDYQFFVQESHGPCPQDLVSIPRPRIGWVGHINEKLDFVLLNKLADRFSAFSFVFVGQDTFGDTVSSRSSTSRSYTEWQQLRRKANVYELGHKEHNHIPRYMANMDVNIMPYRVGAGLWVESCYPLKMHEYLAVGHPVISAKVPAVEPFSEVIDICATVDNWYEALESSVADRSKKNRAARMGIAQQNDWSCRIDQVERLLME